MKAKTKKVVSGEFKSPEEIIREAEGNQQRIMKELESKRKDAKRARVGGMMHGRYGK